MQAEQIQHIIYAGIVGDALGVPVEFQERDTYQVTAMSAGGYWDQPLGTWSDDSAMTLALMANLTSDASYDELFDKFQAFVMWGDYMPAHHTFDVGKTCMHAIRNHFTNQVPAVASGDAADFANGNGALMRLAPLAIVLQTETDLTMRLQLYRDYTSMTHRHPRAILGSYLYLESLHAILNGVTLKQSLAVLAAELLPALQAEPEVLAEWDYYAAYLLPDFANTPRNQVKSTAYVVDTFGTALWCNLQTDTVAAAILLAANLGGDTDTIASIAACWAACRRPDTVLAWQTQLREPTTLTALIVPFAAKFATN